MIETERPNIVPIENLPTAAMITCPGCGHEVSCILTRWSKTEVACDSEGGGCGILFVVDYGSGSDL